LTKTAITAADNKAHSKARWSTFGPGNMDPDQVRRHHRSLKRAGFKSNKDVLGKLGF